MPSKSRLPQPQYLQSIVEWRYERSHRYWDDCGKLIGAIERAFHGLKCDRLDADGFKFVGESRGLVSASFYWDKSTAVQASSDIATLPDASESYWNTIREGLSVDAPNWVGHRTWILYETATLADALTWLDNFGLWDFGGRSGLGLGVPRNAGSVLRTQLENDGRRIRLGMDGGTINRKGREQFGVLVDVDIVVQPPVKIPTSFRDFVASNVRFLREKVEPVFRSR